MKNHILKLKSTFRGTYFWFFIILLALLFILFFAFPEFFNSEAFYIKNGAVTDSLKNIFKPSISPLDIVAYDKKLNELANNPLSKPPITKIVKDPQTGVEKTITIEPKPVINLWPVKTVYPNAGAILPFNRIVAYYGNLYSKQMGVLGEYSEEEMLAKLGAEAQKWIIADPSTPIVPALHYIAVVAQNSPGADGKYRFRMPDSEIDKVLAMAAKIPARNTSDIADARPHDSLQRIGQAGGNALVFLDIQVGFSTIQTELPLLEKYLKLPNVHVGMDPEFSMKSGIRPGKVVGTYDAADINFAADFLARIVKENNLTPKILVVHRYTQKMVTNYKTIKPSSEVQIVMHMDGLGGKAKKIGTYTNFIYPEPVQFTGFKLFYKNDVLAPATTLMTPEDLLKLRPIPIYIQYQ